MGLVEYLHPAKNTNQGFISFHNKCRLRSPESVVWRSEGAPVVGTFFIHIIFSSICLPWSGMRHEWIDAFLAPGWTSHHVNWRRRINVGVTWRKMGFWRRRRTYPRQTCRRVENRSVVDGIHPFISGRRIERVLLCFHMAIFSLI